jgi:hypothetical protein
MINWISIFANSLWIFGLALALATCSYASWQAALIGGKWRVSLSQPMAQRVLALAGIFFCTGLAATSKNWWEIGLWVVLAGAFFLRMLR